MVSPASRKGVAKYLKQEREYSERGACRVAGVSRGSVRYELKKKPEEAGLRKRIRQLARRYPRYGNARITQQLRREGWRVNRKRVHRLRKEEGLVLPRQRPKRRRRGQPAERLQRAEYRDHVWSYDFVEDRTEKGGRLRILPILDEYTRECLALPVAPSMNAQGVIDALEWLFLVRAPPVAFLLPKRDLTLLYLLQARKPHQGNQYCLYLSAL